MDFFLSFLWNNAAIHIVHAVRLSVRTPFFPFHLINSSLSRSFVAICRLFLYNILYYNYLQTTRFPCDISELRHRRNSTGDSHAAKIVKVFLMQIACLGRSQTYSAPLSLSKYVIISSQFLKCSDPKSMVVAMASCGGFGVM